MPFPIGDTQEPGQTGSPKQSAAIDSLVKSALLMRRF
jgi:hypothetical protein